MDDQEERIRRFAYQIWLEEGRPQGRDAIHWEMARELVAIEDNQKGATKPVRHDPHDPTRAADTVEPAGPAANAGELPTMTVTGEQLDPPTRPARKQAAAQRSSATKTTAKPGSASRPPSRPRTKK